MTYLDHDAPLPYCPGCGHPHVLRALDGALTDLALGPEQATIVTDIGCVGMADSLFPTTHTVHSLHGRSVAIASGLQLGRRVVADAGPLKPVVLIGDGGATIGLLHLVHAAQLNVDVTVLVHNNLIYGMTGGQHSGLTPLGLRTTTTPQGSPVPPMDVLAILGGAGAGFLARVVAPGEELQPTIAAAITHPGFACVEVLELCPSFATKRGGVTGKSLKQLPAERGLATGVLRQEVRPPAIEVVAPEQRVHEHRDPDARPDPSLSSLDRTARVVLAGRAGERVQSAAQLAAGAAASAGLHVTLRTDNPVTQGTGFSIAELTIAPERVAYTGQVRADVVLILAEEGLRALSARGLLRPERSARFVIDAALPPPDGLQADVRDLRRRFGAKHAALGALVEEVDAAGWWSREAWTAAIDALPEGRRKDPRKVLERVGAG